MSRRNQLRRAIAWLMALAGLAMLVVLLDYSIDWRPRTIQASYRFELPALSPDVPVFLRRDNLLVVVIRRSPQTLAALAASVGELQNPAPVRGAPSADAAESSSAAVPAIFVALGRGTDLGCELRADGRLVEDLAAAATELD